MGGHVEWDWNRFNKTSSGSEILRSLGLHEGRWGTKRRQARSPFALARRPREDDMDAHSSSTRSPESTNLTLIGSLAAS